MTTITVSVTAVVNLDEISAALNREATQAKKAGDMTRAVSLLREAKARQGDLYHDTRLAKFLQQAGRVDEALAEIQWLLDKSDRWSKEMFGHGPTTGRLRQKAMWCGQVHGAAELICQRAGLTDLSQAHSQRKSAFWSLVAKIDPVAQADHKEHQQSKMAAVARFRNRGVRGAD